MIETARATALPPVWRISSRPAVSLLRQNR